MCPILETSAFVRINLWHNCQVICVPHNIKLIPTPLLLPHLLLSVMQLQVLFDVFCWNIWSPFDTSGSWSASAAADLLADTSVCFWLSVSMLLILDLLRCPRSLLALILIHLTLSLEFRKVPKSEERTASAFDIAYLMPTFIWGFSFSFSLRFVIGFKCWLILLWQIGSSHPEIT